MQKTQTIVHHPNDLTPAWAQCIVNQHHSKARVSRVEVLNVNVGTTTRVHLAVEHNAAKNLASHWFVKLPSLAWRARLITALPRLLHTEVRFYNEIAQSVPLKLPYCLAAQSQFSRGSTLVLADVGDFSYRAGHPGDALNLDQATEVIQQLARFHAHFWQHPHLQRHYSWLAGSVRQLEDALGTALAVPLMKRGLQLAGTVVPAELHEPALNYARQRRRIMAFLNDAPQTLVHHDCHAGNLFWQHNQVGFLDWQLVRLGEGVSDVAYFLSTALTPKMRRLHEEDLLNLYAKTLRDYGVVGVDDTQLRQRYRAHCSYAFEAMLATLAVGGMMALESNLELIRRTAAAVKDLDAFCVLP